MTLEQLQAELVAVDAMWAYGLGGVACIGLIAILIGCLWGHRVKWKDEPGWWCIPIIGGLVVAAFFAGLSFVCAMGSREYRLSKHSVQRFARWHNIELKERP